MSKSVIESLVGMDDKVFFSSYWEQRPLWVKGDSPFVSLFSLDQLKEAVEQYNLLYSVQLNVCKCIDNQKQMLEPFPKPSCLFEVNQYFEQHGATFQVLQPQQYTPEIAELLSDLECYFGCLVGSNVYITPPNSKGLAPHYDDVEVFIIQLEGEKKWKIHKPIDELPNVCSGDLPLELIGEPDMEITLTKGDVLYFPRGWIHHAETGPNELSTHITISTYQKHTYSQLLEMALPIALREATEKTVELRKGLPLKVFSEGGIAYASKETQSKIFQSIESISKNLLNSISNSLPIALHEALDHLSVDFIESRLPPNTSQVSFLSPEIEPDGNGCFGIYPNSENLYVRLLDPSYIRLVIDDGISSGDDSDPEGDSSEDDEIQSDDEMMAPFGDINDMDDEESSDDIPMLVAAPLSDDEESSEESIDPFDESALPDVDPTALVFYSTQNPIETHMGTVPKEHCLRFSIDAVAPISYLIQTYPKFVKIKDIPVSGSLVDIDELLQVIIALWSCGVLISKEESTTILKKRKRKANSKSNQKNKKMKLKH